MLRNHTFLVSVFVALFSLVLSSPAEAKGPHSAKPVVSILGDSYSTFKGYIPDSYACWYDTTPLTDKIQAKRPMSTMSSRPGGGSLSMMADIYSE